MSFIPTDETLRRGSHIVCYALQHPIRPHTMHINITFKQNGREGAGGAFHVLELCRSSELHVLHEAALHCFLLGLALSSEEKRLFINCRIKPSQWHK